MGRNQAAIGFLIATSIALLAGAASGSGNWFREGIDRLKSQECDNAIAAFSRTIETVPYDFEALNNRAVAWFCKNEYESAIMDCSHALEIYEQFPEAYCNRGIAWFYRGGYRQTVIDTSAALQLDPFFFEAYAARAAAYEKLGRYASAADDYEKLVALMQGDSPVGDHPTEDGEMLRTRYPDAVVLRLMNKKLAVEGIDEHIRQLREKAGPTVDKPAGDRPRKAEITARGSHTDSSKNDKSPAGGQAPVFENPTASNAAPRRSPAVVAKTSPYTIHVASFRSARDAEHTAKKMAADDQIAFTAPIRLKKKGLWYRVYVGAFESKQSASKKAESLRAKGHDYTMVMKRPYAVRLVLRDMSKFYPGYEVLLAQLGYLPYRTAAADEEGQSVLGAFRTLSEARLVARNLQNLGMPAEAIRR